MAFKKLNEVRRLYLKWTNFQEYKQYKTWLRTPKTEAEIINEIKKNEPVNINHLFKKLTHVKHSGNAGDVIYSLPAIYELAKNGTAHFHLHINQPSTHTGYHPLGNVMLNEKMADFMMPLLLKQDKISAVDIYKEQPVDYDLDAFRRRFPLELTKGHICRWYFHTFNIFADLGKPWLKAEPDTSYSEYIVIARSHRHHSPGITYNFLTKYPKKVFVGVPEEFAEMRLQIPDLIYVPVKNSLELASIIHGSKLFTGNQSFPFSIAEGLKTMRLLEVFYGTPNVIVEGSGAYDFCFQEHFELLVKKLYES